LNPHLGPSVDPSTGFRPAEQSLGIHEGPQQLALAVDGDPYTAALVPAPGTPFPPSEVTYSKGAALVASLEAYMERFAPGSFQASHLKMTLIPTLTSTQILISTLSQTWRRM